MISPETIERIKVIDPTPEFRAYTIGHEGDATFRMVDKAHGIGSRTFEWIDRAVGWIVDKVKIGTKVFNQHGDTNEHIGRIPIGEVVGKNLIKIKNIVTAVAAFYIYPNSRKLPLDVASIEADIEFVTDDGGQSYPTSVRDITGIALSNSEVDSPGFRGATLLGAVAAFHGQFNQGVNKMTLAEIKQEISEQGYSPSKLFTLDEIIADKSVDDRVRKEKRNLHDQSQRLQGEVDKLKEDLVKKDNEHATEVKKLQSVGLQNKASLILEKIAKTRELTEQQLKFANSHLSTFSTEATDEASLEEDMKKYVDVQMEDLKKTSELLGIKVEGDGDKDDQGKKTVQVEQKVEPDDLIAPNIPDDENPLVPGSKAYQDLDKG